MALTLAIAATLAAAALWHWTRTTQAARRLRSEYYDFKEWLQFLDDVIFRR